MLIEQMTPFGSYLEGRATFEGMARDLLRSRAPMLLDFGSPVSDQVLLDPILFAQLCARAQLSSLDQTFFGYSVRERRAKEILVNSDHDGFVYLPNAGYLITQYSTTSFRLKSGPEDQQIQLSKDGAAVFYEFVSCLRFPHSNIEVSRSVPTAFYPLFTSVSEFLKPADVSGYYSTLAAAFRALQESYPTFVTALEHVVRRVVLFHNDRRNSFASLNAHGAAFLNVAQVASDASFIEDLLHQCGHVLFSCITHDRQSYFVVDPDQSMGGLGVEGEKRSFNVALHALFTEAAMAEGMNECFKVNSGTEDRRLELVGRIGFIMRRFEADLKCLINSNSLSTKGKRLVDEFRNIFMRVYSERRGEISDLNFSNQSYTFDFDRFARLNSYACSPPHED